MKARDAISALDAEMCNRKESPMPNGGFGDVPTEYEKYCDELRWLHYRLEQNYTLEYKIYQCYKGILLILERMGKSNRISIEDADKALEFTSELKKLMNPKKWYQFWKRS